MKQTLSITRKELASYFGSPMALLFVGVFLLAALTSFFYVNSFFARGIADVRPLFQWMPILMIFLVAALTMRQWSEEQRSGTLEMLLTLPVKGWQLVLGKFLAVMALVALSLALTIFLPITVALSGNLDWGPVVGGYIAALLMAAAYTAIGLFISSRTDNQIVALILTALVAGLFYVAGSSVVLNLFTGVVTDILRGLGTGSRFESIERGVIDLRDLVYYLSLAGLFLVLNVLSLDQKRWSAGPSTTAYRRTTNVTALLLSLNLILVNVWVYPLSGLRADLTAQKEYSLSPATRDILANLQEPLLIRGYFSEKTHPYLAPLVPTIRDMLREYQIAGNGKVTVDVLDPVTDPAKEQEANQTYGIQPVPLQVSGQREASIINTYFHILVRYGDQNVVLSYNDLIEVTPQADGTIDVHLRNLEYDLTQAVKKVTTGFQSVDAVLAAVNTPVKLTLIATANSLPQELKTAPDAVATVANDLKAKSNGKFSFELVDPDAAGATISRQTLVQQYRLQPIPVSLFSNESYYLDMLLQVGDKAQVINPPSDMSEASIRTAIESALKRSSTGFLKVVGLWTPPATPTQDMFGQMQQPLSSWQMLQQQLSRDYTVKNVDLADGTVPSDVDVLVLVGPQDFTDKQRYAVDQFLMRGGSVVVAAGSFSLAQQVSPTGAPMLQPVQNGLADMLASYGVHVENSLVMDPQNEPFPVQVPRQVAGMTVNEVRELPYPFFVDVRSSGMDQSSPIVNNLPAVTINWASPLTVDQDAATKAGRKVTTLLKSSTQSWLRTNSDIAADLQKYPDYGYPVEGDRGSRTLAVAIQGTFDSYYKGKPSPLQPAAQPTPQAGATPQPTAVPVAQTSGMIDSSPDTARLVVVGSSEFLDDVVFGVSRSLSQDRYLNSLHLLQNAVDWSVEDLDLLTIRSRGSYVHVLAPMTAQQQATFEGLNYILALLALGAIAVAWTVRRRNEKPLPLTPHTGQEGGSGTLAQQA